MRKQVWTIKVEVYGTDDTAMEIFNEVFPIARRLGVKLEIISKNEVTQDANNRSQPT